MSEMTDLETLETASPATRQVSNPLVRMALLGAGSLFVGLGVLGIFLPLLPTTPFLLLAAFCYGKSSPAAYRWLTTNRYFGKYLRNYQEHRGATVGTKVTSIATIWLGIGFTGFVLQPPIWLLAMLLAIAIGVSTHLIRLRTMRT
jgi:uncharacterized protein